MSHDPAIHAEPTTEAEITARNRLFNIDGFGVAWYTPTHSLFSSPHATTKTSADSGPILHPALYKTIQPPLHDMNFRAIAAATSSTCVLAHIRAATATAIVPVNNHPFVFGRHTIMHNGYISSFPQISRQMTNLMSVEAFEHIGGKTDTEHFAALYMSYLTFGVEATPASTAPNSFNEKWENSYATAEMLKALQHAANTVIDLQQKALGDKAEPNDLNVCVTDGKQLVAMRFRNHPTEQPPSLYYSTSAGVTLNRKYPDHPDGAKCPDGAARDGAEKAKPGEKAAGHNPHAHKKAEEHGRHVIVASEPTTYRDHDWTLIEKNHALVVSEDANVTIEKLTYVGEGGEKA
jgi:glutamine amidotransferase